MLIRIFSTFCAARAAITATVSSVYIMITKSSAIPALPLPDIPAADISPPARLMTTHDPPARTLDIIGMTRFQIPGLLISFLFSLTGPASSP